MGKGVGQAWGGRGGIVSRTKQAVTANGNGRMSRGGSTPDWLRQMGVTFARLQQVWRKTRRYLSYTMCSVLCM